MHKANRLNALLVHTVVLAHQHVLPVLLDFIARNLQPNQFNAQEVFIKTRFSKKNVKIASAVTIVIPQIVYYQ